MRHSAIVQASLAAAGALVAFWVFFPAQASYMREDLMLAIDPSASRAFIYGEAHFDARVPQAYDIERAEKLFTRAALLDPTLPYVFHQLSRIAFLSGDLSRALALIHIQLSLYGESAPNSYYMSGLIKGFMGDFAGAERDYQTYLRTDPTNWAAINDYAWVLMKQEKNANAVAALDLGLINWPHNPWLHNSRAAALFELGRTRDAYDAAKAAAEDILHVTEEEWLTAYPGNDPLVAPVGLAQFKKAVADNMHTIGLALQKEEASVR